MTGTSWFKCLHFWRPGTEDCQINVCDDHNATKLNVHGHNEFRKHCSIDLPQLCLHASSGHLAKETCYNMVWCININDACFNMMDNKILTCSNLSSMLITSYDDLVHSQNHVEKMEMW